MTIPEEIGRNVAFLRRKIGVSREWLSFESHISQTYLYQIEKGIGNPSIETLAKIAFALDVPFKLLFEYDLPMKYDIVAKSLDTYDELSIGEMLFLHRALSLYRAGKIMLEE